MNKTRRHRQRRNKLSRRMKKRGGVPKVPKVHEFLKSILRRNESKKRPMFLEPLHEVHQQILDKKKYNKLRSNRVTINPIVGKNVLPNSPADSAVFEKKGKHTVFILGTRKGNVQYEVNTEIDEDKQRKAINKVNEQIRAKFEPIQNSAARHLRDIETGEIILNRNGHDGKWMCVTSQKQGTWDPKTGNWTFHPEEIECGEKINDDFIKGEKWIEWISTKNDENIFCVPRKYEEIEDMKSQFAWMDAKVYSEFRNKNEKPGAARWG